MVLGSRVHQCPFRSCQNQSEQNNEPAGIKNVGESDNNNIQSQTTKEQTKNTFSKCSKNNNNIKIMPLIQNIVSTADLCCDINLKQIALVMIYDEKKKEKVQNIIKGWINGYKLK